MKDDEDESLVASVLITAVVLSVPILMFINYHKNAAWLNVDWENHPHKKKLSWILLIIGILLLLREPTAKFLGFPEKYYVCDVANPEEKRYKHRICNNKSFLNMFVYVRVFLFVLAAFVLAFVGYLTRGDSKQNTQGVVTST